MGVSRRHKVWGAGTALVSALGVVMLVWSCSSAGGASAPAARVGSPARLATGLGRRASIDVACELQRQGELHAAAQVLREAVQEAPDDPDLREARGGLYANMGYLRTAEADLLRAVEIDPKRYDTWVQLGQVRMELERFAAAADAFDVALRATGFDARHLLFAARAHRGAGRLERACELYAAVLERGEESSRFLCEFASLAVSLGAKKFEAHGFDALELIDDALECQPKNAKAWFVRGLLLESCDRLTDAARAYEEATTIEPERLDAWTNLAVVRHEIGDVDGASLAANRALALEPAAERQVRLERLAQR